MNFINSVVLSDNNEFTVYFNDDELSLLDMVIGERRKAELIISFLYFKKIISYDEFSELNNLLPNLFYSVQDYSFFVERNWDEYERRKEIDRINEMIERDKKILAFFKIESDHLEYILYEDFQPDYAGKLEKLYKSYENAEKSYQSHLLFEEANYNIQFRNFQKQLEKSSILKEEQLEKVVNFDRGEKCVIFIYQENELVNIIHVSKSNFLSKLRVFRNKNLLFKVLLITPDLSTDIYIDFLIENNLHELASLGTKQLNVSSRKYILLGTLRNYAKYKNFTSYSLTKYIKQNNIKIYHTHSNMKFVKFSSFANFFKGDNI